MIKIPAIDPIGQTCELVQAWECIGESFSGFVYTQEIAVEKLSEGCDIRVLTIARYPDGSKRYMPGVLANRALDYTRI